MKSGTKSNKSGIAGIGPRKSKEDFLRWLARKKKTAVAVPEVNPVSPTHTEALMVWANYYTRLEKMEREAKEELG